MAIWYVLFVALTAIVPLRSVFFGGIPFWHDPARDMLLAWDNLSKLTLIGPPGGIPGIFYPPYWIWLLSLPMIVAKDPRFVTLLAITIPFLVLFPLTLWKLKKYFGSTTIFILWSLFIFNFDNYTNFPWSPYAVALNFLILAYLVVGNKPAFWVGVGAALTPSFNLSFGITVILGTLMYEISTNLRQLPRFLAGIVLVFLPMIIFEVRHDFLQSRAFFSAFINSAFYNSAVVGQTGIPKNEILSHLLPANFSPWLVTLFLVAIVYHRLFKEKLFIFLTVCLASLLLVYFSTKNPVWPYHFIGVETLFLLLLGLVLSRSKIITIVAGGVAIYLLVSTTVKFLKAPVPDYSTQPTLASKEKIARFVVADAGSQPFTVFTYSPAIYSFDFDYLFRWLGKPTPDQDKVYLVIPPVSAAVLVDFIHYKTPDWQYTTVEQRVFPDGTTVVERQKVYEKKS